jgi:hypothetical protein
MQPYRRAFQVPTSVARVANGVILGRPQSLGNLAASRQMTPSAIFFSVLLGGEMAIIMIFYIAVLVM